MKLSPRQREALDLIAAGKFFPDFAKEDDGWHARWRAIGCDNGWVDEYVRQSAMTPLTEDAENERHETLHDAWMMALKSRPGLVIWDGRECEEFAAEIREWNGAAEEDVAARGRLTFVFCPPQDGGDGAFSVRIAVPAGRRRLRALGMSMFVFAPLRALRRDGGVLKVELFKGMRSGVDTKDMSFFSAVLFGIIFSVGWTPCVGAFLGSALMLASQQGSMLVGVGMLLCYSLGLGIPFLSSALLIDRLKSAFDTVKRHYRAVNAAAAALYAEGIRRFGESYRSRANWAVCMRLAVADYRAENRLYTPAAEMSADQRNESHALSPKIAPTRSGNSKNAASNSNIQPRIEVIIR